jgi:hypothetical protein
MAKRRIDESWELIFKRYHIYDHNFEKLPFHITSDQIREVFRGFKGGGNRDVRILCKRDTRESRPQVFIERGLFLLPVKNKEYVIVKGEGYVDLPKIETTTKVYMSKLDFELETSVVGDSEMQHIDFAYAASLIRSFMDDDSLVLTIRGRKYTPKFSFSVGKYVIEAQSVQTEVDAGYEGKRQVVLVEVKNFKSQNVIIRQLYYPFRQWQTHTRKPVVTLFFEKAGENYSIWHFRFRDIKNYNSIELVKSACFEITRDV